MTMKTKSIFQMMTLSIENTIICFIIGSIFPLQTTSIPMEIAQPVGRTVSLNCHKNSSDDILWRYGDDNTLIYDGVEFKGVYKGRSHFEIDAATANEVLKISGMKPGDAGLYKCLTARDVLLQSTWVTVLDSEPTCDSNIKDDGFVGPNTRPFSQDDMHFSCAVSYHGSKAPRLQWEDVKNNQILKECDESQPNKTSCNLTLKAEPQYDGSVFRCKVMTSYGEQYNCSTKAIKVHYFNPEESALKPTHKAIGDNISFSVESNLKLSFIWTREENNEEVVVGTDRSYVIDEEGLYYCNVSYNIKDASCSVVLSVVHTSHLTEDNTTETALAICLALAMLVIIILSIIIIVILRSPKALRNCRKGDSHDSGGKEKASKPSGTDETLELNKHTNRQ